jgi:hypothetical protein
MEKSTDENFEKLIAEMEKEQPKEEVKQAEAYYPHIELMREEGLEKSDMPDYIKQMITQFEQKKRQLEKSDAIGDATQDLQQLSSIIEGKIVEHLNGGGGDSDSHSEESDDLESEETTETEPKEKSSEWGILGGIFDW